MSVPPARPVTHKVALGIGLLVVAMVAVWLCLPPRASAQGITFESRAEVTFQENQLRFAFTGERSGGDLFERLHRAKGDYGDERRILWAEISLRGPIEPRRYPIEGESQLVRTKATYRPGPGNDPAVDNAMLSINVENQNAFVGNHTAQMRGLLTIEHASATQLSGYLELSASAAQLGEEPARVSTPFKVSLQP